MNSDTAWMIIWMIFGGVIGFIFGELTGRIKTMILWIDMLRSKHGPEILENIRKNK